ncbi:hypothetical protein ACP4OV_015075 [Aristida adscensionis]
MSCLTGENGYGAGSGQAPLTDRHSQRRSSSPAAICLLIRLGRHNNSRSTSVVSGWQGVSSEMEKASNLRFSFSSSFVLILLSLIGLACPCCKFAYATDTLLPGQVLNASQSLLSKNGAFKLGYDCSIPKRYYSFCGLGIWFANSSSCGQDYFPVWKPDIYPACGFQSYNLSVSQEGVLHIRSMTGSDYFSWFSPYIRTTSISAVAVLLDDGNLVVRDQLNDSMVIWQSLDHPTDVLLAGGHLGFNRITGNNVSLVSYSDPDSLGLWSQYTLSMDTTRRRGFIIQQNQNQFVGSFPRWMDIHEDGDSALTFNDAHTYIRFDKFGILRFAKLGECSSVIWSAPGSVCDFGYCGPKNLCKMSGTCICPVGFDLVDAEAWTNSYCSRKVPLNCEGTFIGAKAFYPIGGIRKYPQNARTLDVKSMGECQSTCLEDCNCTAFAYNTTCLLWFFELQNTEVFGSVVSQMYVRVGTKQQQSSSALLSFKEKGIVLLVIGVLALIVICLALLWRCRRRLLKARMADSNENITVFSFEQIKNSTKSFSDKLGEGGFGCVYKGTMPVSTAVAVKNLKRLDKGDKEFRTEVQTIGMINHTNLVRLLGFCADGNRRLLVYEYMVNGSLNSHLFLTSSAKLSWELRYHVALGTARGLAYLHEECKDCIVHCDMKPDNILLDEQFCPKIADFGMAKLHSRDVSRVLTTMRGTIGYLAPEWISGVPITHKADVYSYGMVLLEIISGRRNSEKIMEGNFTYFPSYAAVKVNEGDVMCLLDRSLEGNADAEQLSRACRIACWCIQDAEDHRPTMGQVVHMLEGVMDVEVPPVPRSLLNCVGTQDSFSADLDRL